MNDSKVKIQLSDGSNLQVNDCEFDFLLHILYKFNFNKQKIEEEIEWVCDSNDDLHLRTLLLKKSLKQFASELSNKILAKSIDDQITPQKIAEDMILTASKIGYTIVESASDMRKILHLRRKIFVQEEGYPAGAVTNGFEKESLHLNASINNELVGCVSVAFDGPRGLPLDKYLDLSAHKKGKSVEIDKLAVVGERRKKELSFQLMWLCYSISRFWGAQRMFIFTLSRRKENIALYNRFGFKTIGEFQLFPNELATVLMLDFDDADTYEKALNTAELLRLGKKLLNKFALK